MNVKTEISLSEDHLRYAERMVAKGVYPSISGVVEAGIAQMMMQGAVAVDPLADMADEIRRRMDLPADQWLPWDGKEMAERVKKRLRARYEE